MSTRPARRIDVEVLGAMALPTHRSGEDKDGRGGVLIIAGSREVPGAALLAATAALRAGAGRLQIATARSVATQLALAVPESLVMGLPETSRGGFAVDVRTRLGECGEHCDAIVLGPGMLEDACTHELTREMLESVHSTPFVLDAAALQRLRESPDAVRRHAGRVVVTPHAGEMAELLGMDRDAVEAAPLDAARRAAENFGCVTVMKGGDTHVVAPRGEAWVYRGGSVGLATSGSGDVLAGLIGGLLARGAEPHAAAVWGVYLHGEAGANLFRRDGGIGFLARELAAEVPRLMAALAH